MELMSRLLQEGGKVIYVAPSGGRDRRNAEGEIEVAPFDPQSVEMFYLMARKGKNTHSLLSLYPRYLRSSSSSRNDPKRTRRSAVRQAMSDPFALSPRPLTWKNFPVPIKMIKSPDAKAEPTRFGK